MRFDFATAGRILFGAGSVRQLPAIAAGFGRRALLVAGHPGVLSLEAVKGLDCVILAVEHEPTLELVREGTGRARREQCDLVVAIGGGSAIDAGKAVAGLVANGGDPLDYLEVIGRGRPLERPSLPCIAVPTTAGAGTEVTRNAVLVSPEHQFKASLRSPYLLPAAAVVDPELTLDLPPAITAATGMDALTQLIEPYVSIRANPMTDLFCLEGIGRAARSLERAFRGGGDLGARGDMSFASLLGGLSLANAGLGAVHGFAAPVGGAFPAPHGAVCAALLPHAMAVNIRALRARSAGSPALARYQKIAHLVTGCAQARPEDGVEWVARLSASLRIPPLRAYGIGESHVPALVEKAATASSMKGNPISLTRDELTDLLYRAL